MAGLWVGVYKSLNDISKNWKFDTKFKPNIAQKKRKELLNKLRRLEQEHRDLDEVLIHLQEKQTVNFSQIQRLKKRKLILKDKIIYLREKTEPDIIA